MSQRKRQEVSIVYRMLPQYRVDFYEGLRATLKAQNVGLQLFYGKNNTPKKDEVDLPWAKIIPQLELNLLGKRLVFQRVPVSLYESSLIIVVQENLILSNYVIALRARLKRIRLALWGHGANFQASPSSLGNSWKRVYSSKADWWFAYTQKVSDILKKLKVKPERVTVVNNAIDTRSLVAALASVSDDERDRLRAQLGIGAGPVGIFCGGMYAEKRLPFLFAACKEIRRAVPNFQLLMIGAGTDSGLAVDFGASHEWAHYVGPKFGLERVPYFSISTVFLMPGLVGLAVLDSFALGTPMITTMYPFHSPEIEYLKDGVNGLITADNVSDYAGCIVDLINDPARLAVLRENGTRATDLYTVESMVANFAEGIVKALDAPRVREERPKVIGTRWRRPKPAAGSSAGGSM